MCLLDIRSGILQESFKIHESDLLQLKFFNRDRFICTYIDGSMALCSSANSKVKLLNLLKVYSDPVTCICVNDNHQMISGTSSNKIGIHSNIDKLNQITYSSSRLLSDNFKGSLSAFTYLPMNRLLCLGSDNGEMKLFC
jgi:WD repeat-containing protein 81